jgi:hypothetical protein
VTKYILRVAELDLDIIFLSPLKIYFLQFFTPKVTMLPFSETDISLCAYISMRFALTSFLFADCLKQIYLYILIHHNGICILKIFSGDKKSTIPFWQTGFMPVNLRK